MTRNLRYISDDEIRAVMASRLAELTAGVVVSSRRDGTDSAESHANSSRTKTKPEVEPVGNRNSKTIELTENDQALLAVSVNDVPITRAAEIAGLSKDAANTSRKRLLSLRLIHAFALTLGTRVGGNVTIIEPTELGWRTLGQTPLWTGDENVSAPHSWIQRHAAAFYGSQGLPAEIEGSRNGKRADVLIHTPVGPEALEVQMSVSNALANVVRDLNAGFRRVLIVARNTGVRRAIKKRFAVDLAPDQLRAVEVKALSECAFTHAYLDRLSRQSADRA